ncbi:hypothetical protein RBH29_00025 [Herbivorax sp. ANBcel31]|uniref:hypothetical protein n=1 Tax=Herbivorax sp. ANBcel31 TaxID=3069754 RepID=UPI0027B1A79C|nr:hypothetical protein [Herbivorax sp. ANBcel31]MDQ2084821.1 hypothetical protein [Herbivorax sp. ANBcel31]
MREKDILNEYPYILNNLKKLNCELNEVVKDKELVESILNYCREKNMQDFNEPTLKAVESVLDRYVNNILYMTGKINNLKKLKNEIDEKKEGNKNESNYI